jgi:hypothetical protein
MGSPRSSHAKSMKNSCDSLDWWIYRILISMTLENYGQLAHGRVIAYRSITFSHKLLLILMNLEGRVGLKQPERGFLIRRHNAVAPASAASLYSFRRRTSLRCSLINQFKIYDSCIPCPKSDRPRSTVQTINVTLRTES